MRRYSAPSRVRPRKDMGFPKVRPSGAGCGDLARQHRKRTRPGQRRAIIHQHRPRGLEGRFVHDIITDRSVARHVWELMCASVPRADEPARSHAQKWL